MLNINEQTALLLVKIQSDDGCMHWVEINEDVDSVIKNLNIKKDLNILDSFTCCDYKVTKKESLEDLKEIRNFLKKWHDVVDRNAIRRALEMYCLFEGHIFLQGCLYIQINKK